MERQQTLAHNRMATWTPADNDELRFRLKSFNIPVSDDRWPYTYACDFWRNHGDLSSNVTRSNAGASLRRISDETGVSLNFLYGLFATSYLLMDSITLGFAVGVAIATNPVVREPFELVRDSKIRFPTFWLPIDDVEAP